MGTGESESYFATHPGEESLYMLKDQDFRRRALKILNDDSAAVSGHAPEYGSYVSL